MKLYIKNTETNKILKIEAKENWLNDEEKPQNVTQYDWACQRYILSLSQNQRQIHEATIEAEFLIQELEKAKQNKLNQLKINRDLALSNKTMEINIDGNGCAFYLKSSDMATIQNRIDGLFNNTDTYSWGDTNGKRVELNKSAFQSLLRHIRVNDITVFDLFGEIKKEIENCNDFQILNNININF